MIKNSQKLMVLSFTLLMLLTAVTSVAVPVNAKVEPSERFKGYNLQKGKWVVGNLGKDYVEGDYVSYQLWIDDASKMWGAPAFDISFNFHQPSSDAIYIDGFDTSDATGFQYVVGGNFLPNGVQTPIDAGSPWVGMIPIPTPDAGGADPGAGGLRIWNYMDDWPSGIEDDTLLGSAPAKERYFTVEGIVWPSSGHIILFFRAHLALDYIWSAADEGSALPASLDGDEFEGWTAAWHGASYATGSSRHFYLQYEGIGAKTIPIPIAQAPSILTTISGTKYVCNRDGTGWNPSAGWSITLELPDGSTVTTVTDGSGNYAFIDVPVLMGIYTVQEDMQSGYYCHQIVTSGPFASLAVNTGQGKVTFELDQEGPFTIDFLNQLRQ